jgi:trans-2-enoyl-CoA reductase
MVVESVSIFGLIASIGVVFAILTNIIQVSHLNKKSKERYATKEYVQQKEDVMNQKIRSIEKDITDNEKHNEREHDLIQTILIRMEKKLDRLIESKAS